MLTYLLSLPLHRASFDFGSLTDYSVYLTNEEGKNPGKPSPIYNVQKTEMSGQGMAEDIKAVLKAPEVDTKKSPQQLEAEKPAVPEAETMHEMGTASEQKIAQVTDVKKPLESLEGKESSLLPEKPKEAAKPQEIRELKKESVPAPVEIEKTPTPPEVDSGFFLKTLAGNVIIPLDAGFKKETVHAEKEKVAETEKKSVHEMEKAKEKKPMPVKVEPSVITETSKEKEVLREEKIKVKTEEKAEPAEIFESTKVLESMGVERAMEEPAAAKRKETEIKKEVHRDEGVSAGEISALAEKPKEAAKSAQLEKPGLPGEAYPPLPKMDEGLFLKTISDKMMIPFEGAFKAETVQMKEKELMAEKGADREVREVAEKKVAHGGATELKDSSKSSRVDETLNEGVPAIKRTGYKGEVKHLQDEERTVAEILTSEKNRMPSQKDYLQRLDDKGTQAIAEVKPEPKEAKVGGKKPPLGIPAPDILLLKDIKIEVLSTDTEMSGLLFSLFKNAHPMEGRKHKEMDVATEREEVPASASGGKKLFSVAKAEKGIYTFTIENKGEKAYDTSVVFRIFEGKPGEKIKEFKAVQLQPGTVLKLKFVLPEAVFWDDEYYFTGTIESSNTLTKFNDRTGLIWKEEKDY